MRNGPSLTLVTKVFERVVVVSLILMMILVILLSTLELGYLLARDILSPPFLLLEIDELLDIFGFFLLILIGLELLETVKAYMAEQVVHTEIVLEVALIAIARKVIILDVKDLNSLSILGIAALILTLALAYFLEQRGRLLRSRGASEPHSP